MEAKTRTDMGTKIVERHHGLRSPALRISSHAGIRICEVYWMTESLHSPFHAAILCTDAVDKSLRKIYHLNGRALDRDEWRNQAKPPEILKVISRLHAPIARVIIEHYCLA
jgi:hypothetical protein